MMAKVIAVTQGKGGVTKTTTAVNLAGVLNERGINTILIDMDKDKPDAFRWKERGTSLKWIMKFNESEKDFDLTKEINQLKTICDVIVLDTPPNYLSGAFKAILLSDYIIIPATANFLDQENAKDATSVPLMANKPFKILMSNIKKGSKFSKELENSIDKAVRFNSYISTRKIMAECAEKGEWIGQAEPEGDNHKQYKNLLKEIIEWTKLKCHTCGTKETETVNV